VNAMLADRRGYLGLAGASHLEWRLTSERSSGSCSPDSRSRSDEVAPTSSTGGVQHPMLADTA
jgi:hypothetical protein